MTRHPLLTFLVAFFGATVASIAEAQTTAWGTNGYVSFNGFYETRASTIETTTTPTINQEPAVLTTTARLPRGPLLDMTVGGRIKGNLGIGFSFSYYERSVEGRVVGDIPHPFYFNQPRRLDATLPLDHQNLAVHMHAMWLLPISKSFQMAVFGGPTYFQIKQQSISEAKIQDDYPFETVGLAEGSAALEQSTRWGLNAGLDASHFFSQYVGVGGMVRYSRSNLGLGSDASSFDVGGLQVGGGIRFRY
jgi:hypothetical protein